MEISQILYCQYCHRLYCFGNFVKFLVLAWNDTFHLIFFVPTSNARWSCLVIKTFERCYIDRAQLPKCKFCKPSHTMNTFSIYLFILTFCLYFLTLNPCFVCLGVKLSQLSTTRQKTLFPLNNLFCSQSMAIL